MFRCISDDPWGYLFLGLATSLRMPKSAHILRLLALIAFEAAFSQEPKKDN